MTKRALIVWGGWNGHEPDKTAAIFELELKNEGFVVEMADSLSVLEREGGLNEFDLIVPNWTMGELSGAQCRALSAAIAGGVGLGGFHGGMGDAFRGNSDYQFIVGGQFVAHPDNFKDYLVNIVDTTHPITSGIGNFKVHSEQYYMHVDPSNHVLANTTFQSESAPWVNGTVMPVAWTRPYGKGRVFYSSIGHTTKEFEIPEVKDLTRRDLVWASR